MDTPSSENCLPTPGQMLEAKLNTTNSNTKKDTDMSTKVEELMKELIDQMQTEVSRTIVANVATTIETLRMKINELEQNLARVELMQLRRSDLDAAIKERIEPRLVRLEQGYVDAAFIDGRIRKWAYENLSEEVTDIVDRMNLDEDIETEVELAIENTDFREYGFLTENDLIKFLNDRVRISVE